MYQRAREVGWLMAGLAIATLVSASCDHEKKYKVKNLRSYAGAPACGVGLTWDPPDEMPPAGFQRYKVTRRRQSQIEHRVRGLNANGSLWAPPQNPPGYDDAWLLPGSTYEYSVRVVDQDDTEWARTSIALSPVSCPPPPPVADLPTQIVLVTFPDGPQNPQASAEVVDLVFGATDSLADFWADNSYGQQTLSQSGPPVWVALSTPLAGSCQTQVSPQIYTDCFGGHGPWSSEIAEATAPFVDWDSVGRVIIVTYGEQGRASTTRIELDGITVPGAWIPGENGVDAFDVNYMAHELGHNQSHKWRSLKHASSITCGGVQGFPVDALDITAAAGCTSLEYNDRYDPMGVGFVYPNPTLNRDRQHFGAYNKEIQGFLPPERIAIVDPADGPVTLPLWPIELAEVSGLGYEPIQSIKVLIDDPVHYSLEYRDNGEFAGVLIRLVPDRVNTGFTNSGTFVTDPPVILRQFEHDVFEDPNHDIRIEMIGGLFFWIGAELEIGKATGAP